MTYCETCGHQYSDICGGCETLDGVPVKYTSDRAVMLPNLEEFMEQFKVVDTDHVYSNGVEFVPIFRVKHWIEYQKSKKKTNADRIRNMTDEELAKTISGDAIYPWCTEEPCKYESWTDCVLAWLKQEVSDDS